MSILLKSLIWHLQKPRGFIFPYRLSLSLLLTLSIPFFASAQNIQWNKTLGGNDRDDFSLMIQTPDGGYLLGGSSSSGRSGDKTQNKRGQTDYWVVKLKADGTKEWDKTFGGSNLESLQAIQPTSDGGYILGGSSNSEISGEKTEAPKNFCSKNYCPSDYWIVKIDSQGNKLWDKTLGGDNTDQLTSLQPTSDGGFILGGWSSSSKSGDKSEDNNREVNGGSWGLNTDYWIVKINANGSKVWDKTLGGYSTDYLATIQQTSDGGYILGGSSTSDKGGDKSEFNRGTVDSFDYWVLKLDSSGKKIWDKTFGGHSNKPEYKGDMLAAIAITADGGYLLGGASNSGKGANKSQNLIGGEDYWVIKVDAQGNKLWDQVIGGNLNDQLKSVQVNADGGYLLGGSSNSAISGNKSEACLDYFPPDSNPPSKGDFWLVKLRANGTLVWDKTIGGDKGDRLGAFLQTNDKGYVAVGTSWSGSSGTKTDVSHGQTDYWIVKLDSTISSRKKQVITFEPIPNVNFGTQKTITLKATASSGLPVIFSVVSGPATVKGNLVTLTGTSGPVVMKASQAGNAAYFTAPEVTRLFIVNVPPVTRLWNKTYGGVVSLELNQHSECDSEFGASQLTAMAASPNGGYLLGGTSDSKKGNDKSEDHRGVVSEQVCLSERQPITDYWIVKTDGHGKKLWDKTFGGNDRDDLQVILPTADSGYLLGGSSKSGKSNDKSQASQGIFDYWVVKIDANGTKLWDKTFGGNDQDNLRTLVATPDGGYLLGGTSDSGISGDKSSGDRGYLEFWIIKIDANGTKLWDKTVGKDRYELDLKAIALAPEGGYLLAGSSTDYSDETLLDYYAVKMDANGNQVWEKTMGGKGDEVLSSAVATPEGGYLLGGFSVSGISGDKTEANRGDHDYWIVKLAADGAKLWDKTYGGKDSDRLQALQVTADGGYLLAGTSISGISGDKTENNRGNADDFGRYLSDYWVVKIAANGQKSWDRTLGSSFSDELAAVLVSLNNEYVVGGTSAGFDGDKTQARKGIQDFWVVKIKEETTPPALAWDMRYGSSAEDNFTSVIKTSDGGYLSGGYTRSGSSGDKSQASRGLEDYWIVKSDKNGKKLWDKRFGGTRKDYLNRVIQTQDGGYLLAGISHSDNNGDKSEVNRGGSYVNRDYWIVKVDAQGNKQWDKTFGGTGFDELVKVEQLATGEYILGGYSDSDKGGDKSQGRKGECDGFGYCPTGYWIVKVDKKGNKVWDKTFGGSKGEVLNSFTTTRDGGLLLVGTSYSSKSGDKSEINRGLDGSSDYWVVRTDKDGNKLWDKTFGGSYYDYAASVSRGNGDSFFISGTSESPASGDKTQPNHLNQEGAYTRDFWVIKVDGTGKKLWDKTLGGNGDDFLNASTFTREGNLILAGTSNSGKNDDKSQLSKGGNDYWIVQLDQDGNKIQDQSFGGSGQDELRTILQTSDGGLLLGGRSDSGVSGDRTQPSQGGTDYWLVKLAPLTSSMVATQEEVAVKAPATLINHLTAYPNPAHSQVTVQFTLPQTQTATLKIYDSQGQEGATLFQGEALANQIYQVKWQAGNKPTGLYFLQLQTSTIRQQQKLLLTK
ncbi:hypothetical protein AHMF7605_10675 [Adhaeribacter arboris]|uniref:Secretion system C-terminal sorting domain-containing protein n=1 Tax=Adhaeribacter arboris TaxID=2072846 RepID=A0A2T2YER3_9BACT|nr:T9SS type A sorting domain-containing protein [Adhaeribacter arboris]PSR53948.1 hypothetical protein AHMF7605_10675 [Adhaeribacter arboris]